MAVSQVHLLHCNHKTALNLYFHYTEPQVRFYAAEVALGLQHMHERHIVYRDLKPANILLCESGHAKISDLGLACDIRAKLPQAAVGTHGYMAPEVLKRGVSYSFTADWFSLGCMLYKLLRGHRLVINIFRYRMWPFQIEFTRVSPVAL